MRNYIRFYSFRIAWAYDSGGGFRVCSANTLDNGVIAVNKLMADVRGLPGYTEQISTLGPWYFRMRSERIADFISFVGGAIAYDQFGNPTGLPIQSPSFALFPTKPFFGWFTNESPRPTWSHGH